jgi:hypothetical protein
MRVEIPMWDEPKILDFIATRVNLHADCKNSSTISGCHCLPEDRWQEPDTYAVMKTGRQTAVRVFGTKMNPGTEIDAKNYIYAMKTNPKDYTIQTRKGGYLRCVSYCNVRFVCPIVKAEGIVPIQPFGGTK